MFVFDLFENKNLKKVVIMAGGFHPWHPGHTSLYNAAKSAFPGADVYVAATNDTKARPFPFAAKRRLAEFAGVDADKFVQVKSPFNPTEITSKYDPNTTAVIFVRSEKDSGSMKIGGVKKDGSPAFIQPLSDNIEPMSQHAYMEFLPTIEFKAGDSGITSATQIRALWPTADDKSKVTLVQNLYPLIAADMSLVGDAVTILNDALGSVTEGARVFARKLSTEDEVIAYMKERDTMLRENAGINYSARRNWRAASSNVFRLYSSQNLSESGDLVHRMNKFLTQFKHLDQYNNLHIKLGSKVSLINAELGGNTVSLWGFMTPKTITKIITDGDAIRHFEFNNDPNDVWPKIDNAEYNGRLITHTAFFGSRRSADDALDMLLLSKPEGLSITNHIDVNNIDSNVNEATVASLQKKIENKRNMLSMAREKRRMKGSKGVQGDREMKLNSEISKLQQELHILQQKTKVNESSIEVKVLPAGVERKKTLVGLNEHEDENWLSARDNPPEVRLPELKALSGMFGIGGYARARHLYNHGLLKATPKEIKLLLKLTKPNGQLKGLSSLDEAAGNLPLAKKTLTTEAEVLAHVKKFRREMAEAGMPASVKNDVKTICSRLFIPEAYEVREGKDLGNLRSAFVAQLESLDEYKSMGIKVGSTVSIINANVIGEYIELWGFITPKTISKITTDGNTIKQFEFNNDPTDVFPRNDLANYNGEELMHTAFFKTSKSAHQALIMLSLSTPNGLTIRNNITESTHQSNEMSVSDFKVNAFESMREFSNWMRGPKTSKRGMTRYAVDHYTNIVENIESSDKKKEATEFSSNFKALDQRDKVKIKVGNSISILSATISPEDGRSRIELSGFVTPKKIVKLNLDRDSKIDSVEFSDGSVFPESSEFTTVGGINITNTVFFPTADSASYAFTKIWMSISKMEGNGWTIENYLSEDTTSTRNNMNNKVVGESKAPKKGSVTEAKGLAKKVKIVNGPYAGKTGWIREVQHNKLAGTKSYYVDLDGGGQADNLPGTALRLVKDEQVQEGERVKGPTGLYHDLHTGVAYSGPTGQDGNDSYMTPEYMMAYYQRRLAEIEAGKYKYPKEVTRIKRAMAKLQGLRSYKIGGNIDEVSDKPVKWDVTYDYYGSNRDVPLYSKSVPMRSDTAEEAIAAVKKLVGGRNHKATPRKGVNEGVKKFKLNLAEFEQQFGTIKYVGGGTTRLNQPIIKLLAETNSFWMWDHLIDQKIISEQGGQNITEAINENNESLVSIFNAFNNFATGNRIKVGDSVAALELEATAMTSSAVNVVLLGSTLLSSVDGVNDDIVWLSNGEVYPIRSNRTVKITAWRQTIFFDSEEAAEKCLSFMSMFAQKAKDITMQIDVTRNDQVNEVSTATLSRYKKKAGEYASAADYAAGIMARAGDKEAAKRWTDRANKKFSGIVQATKKQFDNDAKKLPMREGAPVGIQKYSIDLGKFEKKFGAITLESSNRNKLKKYILEKITHPKAGYMAGYIVNKKLEENAGVFDESIEPNDKTVGAVFAAFNDFATDNKVRVGDKVSVLNLEAWGLSSHNNNIELTGNISPTTIIQIDDTGIYLDNDNHYAQPLKFNQASMWRQTILFRDPAEAKKCLSYMSLFAGRKEGWDIKIDVDQSADNIDESAKKTVKEMTDLARQGRTYAVKKCMEQLEKTINSVTPALVPTLLENVSKAYKILDRNRDDIFEIK